VAERAFSGTTVFDLVHAGNGGWLWLDDSRCSRSSERLRDLVRYPQRDLRIYGPIVGKRGNGH